MNTSKLTGLIPIDAEIRNIKAKHRIIFACIKAARCLTSLKDRSAEKFVGCAISSIDELSEKEICQRAMVYAGCAEIYSIMNMGDKAAFYVNSAAKEIMNAKRNSYIRDHDKIILSIARAGVNIKDAEIVETAMKLCNNIGDRNYYLSGLCGLAISYAHLGKTKKIS